MKKKLDFYFIDCFSLLVCYERERERERERENNCVALGENSGWIYLGINRSNKKLKSAIKIGKTTRKPKGRENKTNGADYYIFFAVLVRDCDLIETTLHQLYAKWNVPKEIAGGEEWFEILDKNGKGWENCLLFLFSRAYDVEIYDKEHCEIISDVLSRDKSKKSSYFKLRRDTTKHEVFKKLNEFMKENCVYCELFYTKQWQLFDSLEKQERNKDKDNKKQIEKIKEKEKQKEKLKKNEQQKNIETQKEEQDATHS